MHSTASAVQHSAQTCRHKGVEVGVAPGLAGVEQGLDVFLGGVVPQLSVVLAFAVDAGHAAHRGSGHHERRSARGGSDHTNSDSELHCYR